MSIGGERSGRRLRPVFAHNTQMSKGLQMSKGPGTVPFLARCSMRPQLVLLLSILLPVEARLCYLGLRHTAYSGPGELALCGAGCLLASLLRPAY